MIIINILILKINTYIIIYLIDYRIFNNRVKIIKFYFNKYYNNFNNLIVILIKNIYKIMIYK